MVTDDMDIDSEDDSVYVPSLVNTHDSVDCDDEPENQTTAGAAGWDVYIHWSC